MTIRIRRRWVIAISCLIISGCTEKTVIREVPASSEPEAALLPGSSGPLTPTPVTSNMVTEEANVNTGQLLDLQISEGSNMVSVESMTDVETGVETDVDTDVETGGDTGIETDVETDAGTDSEQIEDSSPTDEPDESTAQSEQLEDPADANAVVEPGVDVDCDNTLPCRWISADSQFTVTVTNADNFASRDRLQLNYSLSAVHDTQVSVTGGGQALDDAGMQFQPNEQRLGTGVSGNAQTLLAGSTLNGVVIFNQGSESPRLTEWSITILDGGIARLPSFTNVPVGTLTSAYADCELVLPCVWLTPQGDVSITLTAAGGYTTNNRLSTSFTVESTTAIDVALDEGAFAIDSKGANFAGRTHSLGANTGSGKITSQADSGYALAGVVNYYRNSSVPVALNELSLILYQDSPVPRWNPKFTNVPVQ